MSEDQPQRHQTTLPRHWRQRLDAKIEQAARDLADAHDDPDSYERGWYSALCWTRNMLNGVSV